MAVDSRAKRSAAVGLTIPGVTLQLPRADTEITARDRGVVVFTYPMLAFYSGAGTGNHIIFTTAGTFQLRPDADTGRLAKLGRIYSFTVVNVGTTMTVDVYDSDGGEENKVIEYVSADGKVNWNFHDLKCLYGIRIVIGGTPGRVVMEWD